MKLRLKQKIQDVPDEDRYDVYAGGRIVSVPKTDITIWDMELPCLQQDRYRALDPCNLPKPKGQNNVRIDCDARLTPKQMYALHNRIAMVTSWWPLDSNERPWRDLFARFHSMVLYDGNNIPVGIAHDYVHQHEDKVELKYIGLREDMIGKGLGRYFETAVLARMAQQNPDKIVVLGTTSFDVVNGKRALDFHRHMGFAATGEAETRRIPDVRLYYKSLKLPKNITVITARNLAL